MVSGWRSEKILNRIDGIKQVYRVYRINFLTGLTGFTGFIFLTGLTGFTGLIFWQDLQDLQVYFFDRIYRIYRFIFLTGLTGFTGFNRLTGLTGLTGFSWLTGFTGFVEMWSSKVRWIPALSNWEQPLSHAVKALRNLKVFFRWFILKIKIFCFNSRFHYKIDLF